MRLALFADMLKGKPWMTATLSQVGGTEGLGVTLLEETFSASTAPAAHRYQQKAAQAVLKALLPEAGSDIKGSRQSYEALLDASGYAQRPSEFGDLIQTLDSEIRLVTPPVPVSEDVDVRAPDGATEPDAVAAEPAAQPEKFASDESVFGVDWFEAVAYRRWLTAQCGWSEAEPCYEDPKSLPKDAEGNPRHTAFYPDRHAFRMADRIWYVPTGRAIGDGFRLALSPSGVSPEAAQDK